MVSEEEYKLAQESLQKAEEIISQYHAEKRTAFEKRLREFPVFTDDELVYSETTLCPCGHGLAYPKDCGPGHYWDCSTILKGIQNNEVQHTAKLPFAFYKVRSEGENPNSTLTTRGIYKPKQSQQDSPCHSQELQE